MFVLPAKPSEKTFTVPVHVMMLNGDGKKKKVIFKAKFRLLPREELDELNQKIAISNRAMKAAKEAGEPWDANSPDRFTDADVIDQVMIGWEDVADENNAPIPFGPEALEALLDIHPVRPTIVTTFFNTVYGAA